MPRLSSNVASTILIAHPEGRVRQRLRDALRPHGFEVLGTPHVAEVRGAAADYAPSVLLAGGELEGPTSSLQLIEEIAERHAVPGVLLLDEHDPGVLRDLRSPAVYGCVTWPTSTLQLLATVTSAATHREGLQRVRELRSVGHRLLTLQADLSRALDAAAQPRAPEPETSLLPVVELFTPREREVVELLLSHKRPKTIAAHLGISPSTVRNHLKSMFIKAGVASQEELIDVVLRASG